MLPLLDLRREFARLPLARQRKQDKEPFAVTTCAEHPEFFDASIELENEIWDELSFLDYTSAHHTHYDQLLERFPEYHLCMVDLETRELMATGTCVPLSVADNTPLAREGWDWLVDTAMTQHGRNANIVGGLSISVAKQHRVDHIAGQALIAMLALAVSKNLSSVVVPVRPVGKCEHPFVPMEQYVDWVDERGRIFDPWLRSHVAVGGKIMGVCDRSMIVEQPLEFWKPWTQSELDQDGRVPFKGALVPLDVDLQSGVGRYVEPNVWVSHRA
jgi:hypothetical protein